LHPAAAAPADFQLKLGRIGLGRRNTGLDEIVAAAGDGPRDPAEDRPDDLPLGDQGPICRALAAAFLLSREMAKLVRPISSKAT
jgi:hypothetical protein